MQWERQHCPVQWQANQNIRIARKKGRHPKCTFATFSPLKPKTPWRHKNDPFHWTFDLERRFLADLEMKDSSRCAEKRWELWDKSGFCDTSGLVSTRTREGVRGRGCQESSMRLTRLLVGDFIETVLKNFVEMHRLVVAGRHLSERTSNVSVHGAATRGATFLTWRHRHWSSGKRGNF